MFSVKNFSNYCKRKLWFNLSPALFLSLHYNWKLRYWVVTRKVLDSLEFFGQLSFVKLSRAKVAMEKRSAKARVWAHKWPYNIVLFVRHSCNRYRRFSRCSSQILENTMAIFREAKRPEPWNVNCHVLFFCSSFEVFQRKLVCKYRLCRYGRNFFLFF